jgi:type II secretory ATPase GspE/PulE/Tfp pilus assembly ATPase PilB-like protein
MSIFSENNTAKNKAADNNIKDINLINSKQEYKSWRSLALCSSKKARDEFSKDIAEKLSVLPISIVDQEESTLIVATSENTEHAELINQLKLVTSKKVICRPVSNHLIKDAIAYAYQKDFNPIKKLQDVEVNNLVDQLRRRSISINDFSKNIKNEAEAPNILLAILNKAIELQASDFHCNSSLSNNTTTHFRIDGDLIEDKNFTLQKSSYEKLIRHILVISELDITKLDEPQEGMFELVISQSRIRIRISCLPTIHGIKLAGRLLYHPLLDELESSKTNELEALGLDPVYRNKFKNLITKKGGLVLLSGPTGSGKSTLLYAIIKEAERNLKKNIFTVEDPVERQINGITQIEIKGKESLTYSNILTKLLRQDPDIVVLSEIRDSVTALKAMEASLSGILVLATIHGSNVPELLLRLLEMKCPPLTISSTVKLVSSQRLLKKLCTSCRYKESISRMDREIFKFSHDEHIYSSIGCNECNQKGTKGRVPVYEFCEPNFELLNTLTKIYKHGSSENALEEMNNAFANSNYIPFKSNLKGLLTHGMISIDEAKSVLY